MFSSGSVRSIFARLIFSDGFIFSLSECPFGFGLSLPLSLQAVHALPYLLQMVGINCPFYRFIAGQIFAKMVTFCCACSIKKTASGSCLEGSGFFPIRGGCPSVPSACDCRKWTVSPSACGSLIVKDPLNRLLCLMLSYCRIA